MFFYPIIINDSTKEKEHTIYGYSCLTVVLYLIEDNVEIRPLLPGEGLVKDNHLEVICQVGEDIVPYHLV